MTEKGSAAFTTAVFAVALLSLAPASVSAPAAEALAPVTMSPTELFQRARKAEGSLARGAYHIVMRGVIDGDVTVDETYLDSQGYKTTETAGGFTSSWGTYDGQSWYQDPNGLVQNVSGAYSENDPIEIAVRTFDTDAVDARILGVTAGSPAMFAVAINPNRGLHETRYYDAQTYLLRKVELQDYDGRTRTSEYDDYRRVSGRMVPFVRTYEADFYKSGHRYDVVTYEPVRPGSADLRIPASRTLFDLQGRDSVTIPADFTDDGIVVRVNVGQRGLDLMLDSGSSSIVVNASVASQLGLATHNKRIQSFGGLFSLSDARVNDVSIGPLHAASMAINVAPVDDNVAETQRVVGLLGCDFIASGALKVDFAHKTLTMYAQPPADLTANGWAEVPISLDDCVPLAKAAFSAVPGHFILDLGAYDTVLYDHYFQHFKNSITPAHGDPLVTTGSFIGGDAVRFHSYTMRTFGIGGMLFADAAVDVPLTTRVQARDYDGLIGRETLSNFDVLFDYAHQRVYLKPSM